MWGLFTHTSPETAPGVCGGVCDASQRAPVPAQRLDCVAAVRNPRQVLSEAGPDRTRAHSELCLRILKRRHLRPGEELQSLFSRMSPYTSGTLREYRRRTAASGVARPPRLQHVAATTVSGRAGYGADTGTAAPAAAA